MRKSTRDEIGNERDRRMTREEREANHDKWTGLLHKAINQCGFRMQTENNGMFSIIDPDYKEVVAHAPRHVTSKRMLGSIADECGIPMSFILH